MVRKPATSSGGDISRTALHTFSPIPQRRITNFEQQQKKDTKATKKYGSPKKKRKAKKKERKNSYLHQSCSTQRGLFQPQSALARESPIPSGVRLKDSASTSAELFVGITRPSLSRKQKRRVEAGRRPNRRRRFSEHPLDDADDQVVKDAARKCLGHLRPLALETSQIMRMSDERQKRNSKKQQQQKQQKDQPNKYR